MGQKKPDDPLTVAEATMGMVETTAMFAGIAGSMKRALEGEGFATPIAEPAAIQFMWAMVARAGVGPES